MGANIVRSTSMTTVQTFSALPCIRGYMSQGTYGYCCLTYFKVLGVLFLGKVSCAFLPSKKACRMPKFRHSGVGQQYPYVRLMKWSLVLLLAWPILMLAATPDAFEAVHYHIDVTYDVTTHTLQGMASCTAVWRGPQPLVDLYFFLPPNTLSRPDPREPAAWSDVRYPYGFDASTLTVSSVSDEAQQPLAFALHDDQAVPVGRVPDRALLHVRLPRPYHPGERVQVVVAFTTRLPEAKNWGHYRGIVALDGLWYPCSCPTAKAPGCGACKNLSMPTIPCA